MARRIDGTTLGSYRCDCKGCDKMAVYTPVACVPHEGLPIEGEGIPWPMTAYFDVHVCMDHVHEYSIKPEMMPEMRDWIDEQAARLGTRPDFKRTFFRLWRVHSEEYRDWQAITGRVPKDDALAKNPIIMP